MYDELVKKIRHCATDPMHCLSCGEDKDGRCFMRLMTQAADAIEELITERASLVARAAVAEEALRKRRPVARGAWICDQCHIKMLYGPTDFCPNCGADMRPEAPKEDEADV